MTVKDFAQEAIYRLCYRCHYGDQAYRGIYGDFSWSHGVDWRGDIYISPMPCEATVIHEMLHELETDQ